MSPNKHNTNKKTVYGHRGVRYSAIVSVCKNVFSFFGHIHFPYSYREMTQPLLTAAQTRLTVSAVLIAIMNRREGSDIAGINHPTNVFAFHLSSFRRRYTRLKAMLVRTREV